MFSGDYMKKKIIICFALIVCMAVGLVAVYRSQNPTLLRMKKYIKYKITYQQMPVSKEETGGLDEIEKTLLYENGYLVGREKINPLKDNKKVYLTKDTARLVNYPHGYMVDLPQNVKFDFDYSPLYTKVTGKDFDATLSMEYSPYDDVDGYLAYYLNRFILSEDYQKGNNLNVSERKFTTEKGHEAQVINAEILNPGDAQYSNYAYVLIKTNTRIFYRMMFRYNENIDEIVNTAVESFSYFSPIGEGVYNLDFKPQTPKHWSDKTKDLYEKIENAENIRWGIFAKNIYGEGIDKTVPEIEQKTGYTFPVILSYVHFTHEFPTEFMNKNYENGRIVELTYQITDSNNEKLFGYTPNLDIYRGLKDEEIRKFARAAKEFGHPFLFRLNNEMNSDWTSYSGIVNMSDPEIFIANWRRFYDIFKEEGVDNAIWIYNPNDHNYPPCNWNNFLAYYPGDKYVQMIGVTGYNTGTYYKDHFGEQWREFETIYDDVDYKYQPFFSEFPWIITEFGSSSVGGNKVQWINNMFDCIDKYENIKIAVWFSYADYDYRPEHKGKVARPYWLDETEETLNAFKNGIKHNSIEGWK